MKRAADDTSEKLAQSGRGVEASVRGLETRLDSLEASLKPNPAQLEAASHEEAVGRKALQAQLASLLELSREIKREQGAGSSSSSGWLVPALVCGQMLCLAAFVFYRQVSKDKKRDHFL